MRPVYERLTQTETLNNLVATFSGICMLMDDVYDLYFSNDFTSEIIDSLSQNCMVSQEIVGKKIKKTYSLNDMNVKYNSDSQFSFPPDLEQNIQSNLTFEITEYATLVFQNIRSLYSL
mmetsp:Transcript_21103/g.20275  ORF Transcript_21103/g.20275 Transcript_21103/m.20275 type:complete len:118 (+) Transcript_21103:879-1232(+)